MSKSGVICLWVLDPGQHSGIVSGRVWERGTSFERLNNVLELEANTIEGDEHYQMRKLHESWQNFQYRCRLAGLPYEMVIEDFILTRLKSSERSGISPVRVTSAFLGYRHGLADAYENGGFGPSRVVSPIFQTPSEALGAISDARLREYGLWLPGTAHQHERAALKHFCLRVKNRAKRVERQ